jgi:osmotically-inducible protein OsmY
MRRILTAVILSATLLDLGGCVLAVGNGDDSGEGSSWSSNESHSSLARAVRAGLDGDPLTQDAELSVSTDDGRVYLSGTVTKPEILARAVEIALATPDVKSVRCRVTVIRK